MRPTTYTKLAIAVRFEGLNCVGGNYLTKKSSLISFTRVSNEGWTTNIYVYVSLNYY